MLYAIAAVAALIADQALKYWVTANIQLDGGFKPLIPGFIRLSNIHNSGAAFSFLSGVPPWVFVVLCILFVLVVVWLLIKRIIATPGARWAAVFVMAGALGNCVDRIISGYVVDMLEFEFMRFPVFNLADILITVGAIVFCICLLLEKPPAAPGKAAGTPAPSADTQNEAKIESAAPKAKKAQTRDFARTPYVPPEPAPRRPEPPPFDPENPFAEWELPQTPAQYGAPVQPAASNPPAAPARPDAPVPPEPEVVESFSLEDILSEFKDGQ